MTYGPFLPLSPAQNSREEPVLSCGLNNRRVNAPYGLYWRGPILEVVLSRKRPRGRDTDTEGGDERRADDLNPYDSLFGRSESADRSHGEPRRDGSTGEHIRRRIGLSGRQWTWLVSLALFVPYPIFIVLGVVYDLDDALFIPVTLAFSVVLIVLSFYL